MGEGIDQDTELFMKHRNVDRCRIQDQGAKVL